VVARSLDQANAARGTDGSGAAVQRARTASGTGGTRPPHYRSPTPARLLRPVHSHSRTMPSESQSQRRPPPQAAPAHRAPASGYRAQATLAQAGHVTCVVRGVRVSVLRVGRRRRQPGRPVAYTADLAAPPRLRRTSPHATACTIWPIRKPASTRPLSATLPVASALANGRKQSCNICSNCTKRRRRQTSIQRARR
jgi:hypothetical protein